MGALDGKVAVVTGTSRGVGVGSDGHRGRRPLRPDRHPGQQRRVVAQMVWPEPVDSSRDRRALVEVITAYVESRSGQPAATADRWTAMSAGARAPKGLDGGVVA